MNVAKELKDIYDSEEYVYGERARIVELDNNKGQEYNVSIGDIVEVTYVRDKSIVCGERDMRLCNKINRDYCIKFTKVDDVNKNYIWSCYCKVERI